MNILKEDKHTTFHRSQIILKSIINESKSYFITSLASSLITLILSLFECIIHSASLSTEDIK